MTDNDDGNLEDYFLSTDNSAVYGKPPESIFHVDNMITGTKVMQWLWVLQIQIQTIFGTR